MCQNGAVNGVTKDGGYAEYVLLRIEAVVKAPTDVDPVEYAPILCAGITVFNSIRKLKITPGDIVAVQGLGGLGHLAVQYANSAPEIRNETLPRSLVLTSPLTPQKRTRPRS
jgi:D-arabinose 1-dehydrogenase-like Zn-dependent alcohol dehydrogenase